MSQQAQITVAASPLGNELMSLLTTEQILPGDAPSYQACKTLWSFHPLGAKIAESPVKMAQSQAREIEVPHSPGDRVRDAFIQQWKDDKVDSYIATTATTARVYGIASIAYGAKGVEPSTVIDPWKLRTLDLYFSVFDPLNTAGSLVLNQDPNAPDFQQSDTITVSGVPYHRSRSCVIMNEKPIYIAYTSSAYGYVGRSVYQRAFYPLKTFVQSMLTDDMVTQKAGLLIVMMKAAGAIIDNVMKAVAGLKRTLLQGAVTGNVLQIGQDDKVETLNMMNLDGAAGFARNNVLKNIATAADMPASLLNQETMAEGFGEGTEDAKNIARYVDGIREWLEPLYKFMEPIIMYRAWTPEFYASIQADFPEEYEGVEYKTAFMRWKNSFNAAWPNLLKEPDSELAKAEDVGLKAAIGMAEIIIPIADPENKAMVVKFLADYVNGSKFLFKGARLDLDYEALAAYEPPTPETEPKPAGPESEKDSVRRLVRSDAVFVESDHPRDDDGKFTDGGGSSKLSVAGGKTQGGVAAIYSAATKSYAAEGISPTRIKALAIPPGWKDVRISHDEHADLQVLAVDSKGRPQYRYSEAFTKTKKAQKFERVGQFNAKRNAIEAATIGGIERGSHAAAAVRLMYLTGMRPGGDEDTGAKEKAYGATTLLKSHVKVDDNVISYDFIGKKGVRIQNSVRDDALAGFISKRLTANDGDVLFRASAAQANAVIKGAAGEIFKAKDLRTLKANQLAADTIAKMDVPAGETARKEAVKMVATVVSKQLGNTPSVALADYINPMVFEVWQ
jgi:DNA topoisomerase IB